LTSNTWIKGKKISWQEWYFILYCWCKKTQIQQASDMTELSIVTVRYWYEKFRDNLPEPFKIKLCGNIQMDEAFYGGKGGMAILGAKQVGSKKIMLKVLPHSNVNRHHILEFLIDNTKPHQSKLLTDGAAIYKTLDKWYPIEHECEIHSKFEFELTSQIEGLWGNLKTFIRRMYHHVTLKKLPKIVSEFCLRFCRPEIFKNPHDYLLNSLSLVPTCF
jgi:hypothetical protein